MPAIIITDWTTLNAALASWLTRSDLTLEIPGFIQLAEAKIKRLVRRKTLRADLTISAYANALTGLANFGELRSLHLVTSSASLDRPIAVGSPEQLASLRTLFAGTTGRPQRAAIVGTELLVGPTPDQSYTAEATYFEALQALSATNTTNSILLEAPDLYLWGALMQAEKYLENDPRVTLWKTDFAEAVEEINAKRQTEEYSASFRPVHLPVVYG